MNIYNQIQSNKFKSYFIILLFIGIVTLIFYLAGKYFNHAEQYLYFGLIISLVTGIGSYFFSDRIVLSMSGAHPADKKDFFDYYTVTENLCIAAGTQMPKLYVIDDPVPNAFATGRDTKHAVVAATTGLLERLDRAEIEGVIAHELSHVKNYDILVMTVVTVLVGTIGFAVDLIMRAMMWGGLSNDDDRRPNPVAMVVFIVALIIMPIIASLIQFAVSRKREFLADASGALLTRNPEGLASALEKISSYPQQMKHATTATAHMFISNPFKQGKRSRQWLMNLFSTHPQIEERIKILRSM